MTESKDGTRQLSIGQLTFLKSKVNGGPYHGEGLPELKWNWPQGTYLQQRLQYLKGSQERPPQEAACIDRSAQVRFELSYEKLLEQS